MSKELEKEKKEYFESFKESQSKDHVTEEEFRCYDTENDIRFQIIIIMIINIYYNTSYLNFEYS